MAIQRVPLFFVRFPRFKIFLQTVQSIIANFISFFPQFVQSIELTLQKMEIENRRLVRKSRRYQNIGNTVRSNSSSSPFGFLKNRKKNSNFLKKKIYQWKMCILRSYLSTIPTYNSHLNSHFLFSRSGNSFLRSGIPQNRIPT